jgi:hypothetical protein
MTPATGYFVSVAIAIATGAMVFPWVIVSPRQLQKMGFDPARLAGVPAALISGVILALLNWRWDGWISAVRGTDLVDAHRFLPMRIIHLATLLFVLWVAALAVFTRPRARK